MSLINYPVWFDGVDLQSVVGITVLRTDPYRPAKRRLGKYDIARTSQSVVSSGFYERKEITVGIAAQGLTRAMAEMALDTLLAKVQGREKQLLLLQGPTQRTYTATLSDVVLVDGGGAYIEVDLVFDCSDKYGYDPNYTTIVNLTGVTSSSRTDDFTFEGSAETQAPHIEFYLSALSASDSVVVAIGNQATGQEARVSWTPALYDRLIIDSRYNTATLNGDDAEWTGAFPKFASGPGSIYISTTGFTSHTYNYFAYYHKRFI